MNSKQHEKSTIGDIYRKRWMVELDLAAIKTIMKMDMLRCKTPDMVRKEIWVHLLAYNAIRKIIVDAAIKSGKLPNQISFKATVQTLNHYSTLWRNRGLNKAVVYGYLLDAISKQTVGNRPGRHEPRERKRRPKAFPLLHGSRNSKKNRKGIVAPKTIEVKPLFIKKKEKQLS